MMLELNNVAGSSYYLQTIPIFAVGTFESPIRHIIKHVMPMTTVVWIEM